MHGIGCNTENPSRHVSHALQMTTHRHVHAVIIAWRQVDGMEESIVEIAGCRIIGEQVPEGIMMSLGLQYPVVGQSAALADFSVTGRNKRGRIRVNRSGASRQFASKKGIERFKIGCGFQF